MPLNTITTDINIVDRIRQAKINMQGVVQETPLLSNYNLSRKYNCNVLLKREDLQSVRSFKIRGAYNKISQLSHADKEVGIICASAGNHAQGVAYSCSLLKIHGLIYMPVTTPKQKLARVKHFGRDFVQVILEGDDFDQSFKIAQEQSLSLKRSFIHPFNDLEVIAGQGTIAMEILASTQEPIDYLFVPIGGGGLASGVSSYFKTRSPNTKIIGLEAEGAPAMHDSLKANRVITLSEIDKFADGIAVKKVGDLTFQFCRDHIDEVVKISEGNICSTILEMYNEEALVVEPSGAIGIAALDNFREEIKNKNVAIILSGGNNDINRTEEIRERALLAQGLKHYFIIKFPQRAGALKEFLEVLGPSDDIAFFQYTKKTNRENGPALVGIELKARNDYSVLIKNMKIRGIDYFELNKNPLLFQTLV